MWRCDDYYDFEFVSIELRPTLVGAYRKIYGVRVSCWSLKVKYGCWLILHNLRKKPETLTTLWDCFYFHYALVKMNENSLKGFIISGETLQ